MIPKIIHYCWFGRNDKSKLAMKCLKSWKKYCPDYEIIEWNEDNYNIDAAPLYVQQAYKMKKWAFVTDYVRLQVVYENGGIYFDTDVELLKGIDNLLSYKAFFGFETEENVATGLGFGAEKGIEILRELMQDYQDIPFIKEDNQFDTTPCPQRNSTIFLKYGLKQNGETQKLKDDSMIFSREYFCPMDYYTGKINKTKNTISIHHYEASWQTKQENSAHRKMLKKYKIERIIHTIIHLPNIILRTVMGQEKYDQFKNRVKNRVHRSR